MKTPSKQKEISRGHGEILEIEGMPRIRWGVL